LEQESESRVKVLPRNVKLLGWASCLNDVASEMIYPLLPQFLMSVLGGNKTQLGIIEGAVESLSSWLKLAAGAWSDRTGRRKPFVVIGYTAAALARPAIALAGVPWHLLAARSVDRIGKGVRTAPRDAIIAASTSAGLRGTAFGFHRAMDHLGAAIGPVVAYFILRQWPDSLRSIFALTLLPGIAVIVLVAAGLREPKQGGQRREEELTGGSTPLGIPFRIYMVALVVFTLGNSSDAFLLVRAGELGVASVHLPLLWFAFHVSKSLGNLIGGRLVDRIGPRLPLIGGWFVYAGVYVAFSMATTPLHVWVLFLGYAVYYSLAEPAEKTLVAKIVGPRRAGLAFGWYNFAIGIAALPASVIFGWLYEHHGPAASFGWGAALAMIAMLLIISVKEPRR
jgi:MFS family permease